MKAQITINENGWSVKGCSYIYAPRGQAGEYSKLAANPYSGCGHKCAYCYVPSVLRMDRKQFDQSATERPNYLHMLRKDAAKYRLAGITDQVMLSFTTDPYHPFNNTLTADVLDVIAEHGMGFCTLTKGGARALRDLHKFRPSQDSFASTLTTTDPEFSKKWERGAAMPDERISTLKKFHDAGIFTWVSLEPTLSVEESLKIVQLTHQFVDLYKVGRANYLPMTNTTNWEEYTHRMVELLQKLGKKHYIKKDLQKFLPIGYHNPIYIEQHN